MNKRIISLFISVLILISSFSAITANAFQIKSLSSITASASEPEEPALSKTKLVVEKGKTATLKLSNAKADDVSWNSSDKDIASVSDKGVVSAKKTGSATITAKYSGKKYSCAVTVKTASQITFGELKSYLVKHGKKEEAGTNISYSKLWEKDGVRYKVCYSKKNKEIYFETVGFTNSRPVMINHLSFTETGKTYLSYENRNGNYRAEALVKKSEVDLDKGIDFTLVDGKNPGDSELNKKANAFLKATLPDYNSYLSKNAKISLKQLGFKNWE